MRFGFIGGFGHHYLRAAVTAEDEVLVSGDGRDDVAAKAWMSRLDRPARWVDSPEALLSEGRLDLLSVGAIYDLNGEWAIRGIERSVPVVSDKPVATSWAQLDRVRRATEKGVLLTEFDMRCRPEFAAARKAIAEGRIGDVVLATAQKSYRWGTRPAWYADRNQYGGTVLWVAAHGIDAIRYCTNQKMTAIGGRSGNLSHLEFGTCEDHTVSLFSLEGGGSGLAHADYLRPATSPTHGDDRLRVAGTKGVVEVREGRCVLMNGDAGPEDITETVYPAKVHMELMAAALGRGSEVYSTAQTLELAELLLSARDVTTFAQK
jgi:predicted dehydrogenase